MVLRDHATWYVPEENWCSPSYIGKGWHLRYPRLHADSRVHMQFELVVHAVWIRVGVGGCDGNYYVNYLYTNVLCTIELSIGSFTAVKPVYEIWWIVVVAFDDGGKNSGVIVCSRCDRY